MRFFCGEIHSAYGQLTHAHAHVHGRILTQSIRAVFLRFFFITSSKNALSYSFSKCC